MKTIKLAEPRQVGCVELKKPVLGPGQALTRIKTIGIYGSDVGIFRGTNKLVSYPRIIGHELADIIEEIPADNLKGLKIRGKVTVDPYLHCGTCYLCSIGRTSCCTSLKILGVHINGKMAEYYCHLADMLVKMPEDMNWTDAAMAESLAISLHEIHRDGLKAGEYCTIIGADPIELLAGMIARAYGAYTAPLDLVQERLDSARELGIECVINFGEENPMERVSGITGGTMAQQVAECSSASVAMLQTLDLVSHADRVILTGWLLREIPILTDVITRRETGIRGAYTNAGEFEEIIELTYIKKVDVVKILTKTIGLEEIPETVRNIEENLGNYTEVVVKAD